jgi:Mrp family chromosome partitioning ATPase
MSIMESALERAKQRVQPGSTPAAPHAPQTPYHRYKADTAAPAAPAPAPSAPLEFTCLDPDSQAVEEHRILWMPRGKHSTATDAYRILRTRLSHRIQAQGWSSLGITSPGPGEGKSVTALNLALALASEKKRNVFLLDLDLRKPSICRYLGVRPGVGVGQYLSGEAGLEGLFFSIGTPYLVVASGTTTYQHSADLLGSERLAVLLAHIRTLDPEALIVADLPPLLSLADALVVLPKLSAALLVVAEGITHRDGLTRAREVLGDITLAGIMLNRSSAAVHSYYG